MQLRPLRGLVAVAVLIGAMSPAFADEVTLLCAGAMKPAVSAIIARRDASSPAVRVTYATAGEIRARFAGGERPDLVIAPSEVVSDLVKEKLIDVSSRRVLGETEIGIAVKSGAPKPDISTEDALKKTLLAAKKIVIVDPAKGTSGRLLESMFRFMGIENEMRDKLIRIDGGMVTEAVARGDADLGFQQVSEILPVAGVDLVGTLPGTLKKLTRYDVAAVIGAGRRQEAESLLRELTSADAHAAILKSGFSTAN